MNKYIKNTLLITTVLATTACSTPTDHIPKMRDFVAGTNKNNVLVLGKINVQNVRTSERKGEHITKTKDITKTCVMKLWPGGGAFGSDPFIMDTLLYSSNIEPNGYYVASLKPGKIRFLEMKCGGISNTINISFQSEQFMAPTAGEAYYFGDVDIALVRPEYGTSKYQTTITDNHKEAQKFYESIRTANSPSTLNVSLIEKGKEDNWHRMPFFGTPLMPKY